MTVLLSDIVFEGGRPMPRSFAEKAPGGWQGRVCFGRTMLAPRGGAAPVRVACKFFLANISAEWAAYHGVPQTDADVEASWRQELAAMTAMSDTGCTARLFGSGYLAPAETGLVLGGFAQPAWYIIQEALGATMDDELVHAWLGQAVAMAQVLEAFHGAGWIHGDVHRGNFVFDRTVPPRARLIDPGNAREATASPESEKRRLYDVACFGARVLEPLPAVSTEFSSFDARLAVEALACLVARLAHTSVPSAAAIAHELEHIRGSLDRQHASRQAWCLTSARGRLAAIGAGDELAWQRRAATNAPCLSQTWLLTHVGDGKYRVSPGHNPAVCMTADDGAALRLAAAPAASRFRATQSPLTGRPFVLVPAWAPHLAVAAGGAGDAAACLAPQGPAALWLTAAPARVHLVHRASDRLVTLATPHDGGRVFLAPRGNAPPDMQTWELSRAPGAGWFVHSAGGSHGVLDLARSCGVVGFWALHGLANQR